MLGVRRDSRGKCVDLPVVIDECRTVVVAAGDMYLGEEQAK
jgi:hypothetical protein